jgi:hypothetical protein
MLKLEFWITFVLLPAAISINKNEEANMYWTLLVYW